MVIWCFEQSCSRLNSFYFYGLFMVRVFATWGNINLEWFIVLNILLGKGIKLCWIKSIIFSLVVPFYKSVIEKQKQTSNKAEQDTARDASRFHARGGGWRPDTWNKCMHFLLVWFYFFYATILLMHMVYDNFIINVIFIKDLIACYIVNGGT